MSEHIVTPKTYLIILACLVILTVTTVAAAFQDFGDLNNLIAVGIAVTKAALVVLFFMHGKWGSRMVKLAIFGAGLWLVFLLMITWFDYWSRGWMDGAMPF
ncbi:MAG: cytochrome C oxidase subunit IV family protein [Thermoanaerobaculia bacterium]|nr:cytochrome C oxidase subunit IV family protein [Thermoanaerobaculia bacterium]